MNPLGYTSLPRPVWRNLFRLEERLTPSASRDASHHTRTARPIGAFSHWHDYSSIRAWHGPTTAPTVQHPPLARLSEAITTRPPLKVTANRGTSRPSSSRTSMETLCAIFHMTLSVFGLENSYEGRVHTIRRAASFHRGTNRIARGPRI